MKDKLRAARKSGPGKPCSFCRRAREVMRRMLALKEKKV